ncbi:hypothetical protein MMC18_004654 [Xylographa bjoerkii]|nr:hypothetical protein [Xylographa bjoerkii]
MGQIIGKPKSRSAAWPPLLESYPSFTTIDGPRSEKTIITGLAAETTPWHSSQAIPTGDSFYPRLLWPYEVRLDHEGYPFVLDHVNLLTTWEDPMRDSSVSGYLNGRIFVWQDEVDSAIAMPGRFADGALSSASTLNDDDGLLKTANHYKTTCKLKQRSVTEELAF